MLRALIAIFLILPSVLFYAQMSMFPMPDNFMTEGSADAKSRLYYEEQNGIRAVHEEVVRQAAAINYPDSGWQQMGQQSMVLLCLRRPETAEASAANSVARQSKCQCLARASLVAETREEMRYIVLKAMMIERLELLRVRLPQTDVIESEITSAVSLPLATARTVMERLKKKTASC